MIAVITGDIINSQTQEASAWLKQLKEVLNHYGKPIHFWEIYRGDSFQLELKSEAALLAAIHIKASIKQLTGLDVRMAIGLGDKTHKGQKVTESNGSAFVNSGEEFENIKKQTLSLRSPSADFDGQFNLLLALALLTMNGWSTTVATVVREALEHPGLTQMALAKRLERTQSSISENLSRAGFEEIMRMERRYRDLVQRI